MSILAERLKAVRKQKKITQRQLAAKLGVAPSTIALYETGDRNPDPQMINKLADFFCVSADYLLGRTDNPTPTRKIEDVTIEKIGFRIALLREQKKISLNELSRLTGLDEDYLSRLEKGQLDNLSSIYIKKIADVLNTSSGYLMGLVDDPDPKKEFTMALNIPELPEEYKPKLNDYVAAFIKEVKKFGKMIPDSIESEEEEEILITQLIKILEAITVDGKKIPLPVLRLLLANLQAVEMEMEKSTKKSKG